MMARLFARGCGALFFVVCGFLGAQGYPGSARSNPTPFEVPREYGFLFDWGFSSADTEALRSSLSLERIVLERTACLGTCPVYRLELGRSGAARYRGTAFVEREGEFEGEVYLAWFGRLAFALERVGFYELRANYAADWTDAATTVVTAVLSDGRQVRVSDYGDQAPPEFWLIAAAIDGIGDAIEWAPSAESGGQLP